MSTQRISPKVPNTFLRTYSEGLSLANPERSVLLRNHLVGRFWTCSVSGLSPGFISFMALFSRKNPSHSDRVGKGVLNSAALTLSSSANPLSLIVFMSILARTWSIEP